MYFDNFLGMNKVTKLYKISFQLSEVLHKSLKFRVNFLLHQKSTT